MATPSARILIVDDEVPLLESYEAMLETDHEILTATTAEKAHSQLDETIDIILLDRRMPGEPGETLLTTMNSQEFDCQILFCSAIVPDVEIIPLPIDGYLHKPVGIEALRETIKRQLQISQHEKPVREYMALRAKRDAIDDAKTRSILAEKGEYQQLCEELDEKAAVVAGTPFEKKIA